MCDEFIHAGLVEDPRISRRTFGLITAAAAGAATGAFADAKVVEKDVDIATPSGTCDAVLYYPEGKGAWPAVLIWTDIMGLRPVFRDMGRRLAAQGYVVLTPNPFYRTKRAPVMEGPIDMGNADQRNKLLGYMAQLTDDSVARDAQAYIAFLDAQPQTNKTRKAAVQGYCMGGPLSIRAAAAVPSRIGAAAAFHGGNAMATDRPNSAHLLISKAQASFLVCQAQDDDAQQPKVKDMLKAAFAEAKRPASVEVYAASHGWCVKGNQTYDEAAAERAWTQLTRLYESTLV